MGMSKQVEEIIQYIRSSSPGSGMHRNGITWRSILVSATVTNDIQELAKKILGSKKWLWARAIGQTKSVNAIPKTSDSEGSLERADVINNDGMTGKEDYTNSTPRQLAQQFMVVSAKLRLPALIAFLVERVKRNERTVVFMATCDIVDYMYALLTKMESIFEKESENDDRSNSSGIFGDKSKIFKLHGSIPRDKRQHILKDFGLNSKGASVLFATDGKFKRHYYVFMK